MNFEYEIVYWRLKLQIGTKLPKAVFPEIILKTGIKEMHTCDGYDIAT